MILWHGYPQHEDAHPERPWWRRHDDGGWRRSDGAIVRAPILPFSTPEGQAEQRRVAAGPARVDREHPMPVPPPLVGQVWHHVDHRTASAIVHVGPRWQGADPHLDTPGPKIIIDEVEMMVRAATKAVLSFWPPHGAVLAAGPLSPWAPQDYEVEP